MSPFRFEVERLESAGAFLCKVSGAIDAQTVREMEQQANRLIHGQNERLIFDFSDLNYINSQGLGVLLSLQRILTGEGAPNAGGVVVVSVAERVNKIFEMVGISSAIPTYPSLQAALKQDPLFQGREGDA